MRVAARMAEEPSMNETVLLPEQVAEVLKVCPTTVIRMAKRGDLRAVKIGRRWRITQSAVDEFLAGA